MLGLKLVRMRRGRFVGRVWLLREEVGVVVGAEGEGGKSKSAL